jgi:hypothetical protein
VFNRSKKWSKRWIIEHRRQPPSGIPFVPMLTVCHAHDPNRTRHLGAPTLTRGHGAPRKCRYGRFRLLLVNNADQVIGGRRAETSLPSLAPGVAPSHCLSRGGPGVLSAPIVRYDQWGWLTLPDVFCTPE